MSIASTTYYPADLQPVYGASRPRPLRPGKMAAMALVGALTVAAPATALADDSARAKALFDTGLAHMNAGRYAEGCPALAESRRLDPRAGTLFTLAICQSQWGRIATATALLDEYLALVERQPPADQQRQRERVEAAKKERREIAPRIPELTLSLAAGVPAGTVVKRDGRTVERAALGVASRVDPGEHTISTEVPGGPVREQRVTIAEGEKKRVTLDVSAPPHTAEPAHPTSAKPAVPALGVPAPVETPRSGRTLTYMAGGVGLAGLAVGAVTGVLALGKRGVVEDHCGSAIQQSDKSACDGTGYDAAKNGASLGLVSTIGLGVGLAGVGAAALLLWTEPNPADHTAGTAARWISAGVLEAGESGAIVGARGAW